MLIILILMFELSIVILKGEEAMGEVYRKSNFVLFALGRLVSLIGAGIQTIVLPLYILDVTGSATTMGVFTLLSIIPRLAATPFAGVFGDRWNRKMIMVYADFGHGILLYLLFLIALSGQMTIALVFVSTALLSVLDAFFSGATSGMIPDIVPESHLKKANSTLGFVSSVSNIIGPVLGGILYGLTGIGGVFLINATCFTLSAISEIFIHYHPKLRSEKLTMTGFVNDLKEGASFVFRKRGLKALFLFAMVLNFISSPIFYIVFPFVLKTTIRFSSQQYGTLQSALVVGSLIGNLIIIKFLLKASNKKMLLGGLFSQYAFQYVFGITLFQPLFGWLQNQLFLYFWIVAVFFAIMGFFNTLVNVPIHTNLQVMTPTEIRSRVFSVLELLSQIMVPIGAVIYGFLMDHLPVHWFLIANNSLCVLVTVVFLWIAPPEVYDPHLEGKTKAENTTPCVESR